MRATPNTALILAVLLTLPAASHSNAVETIAEGFEQPWSVAFLPEGGYLVTELPGRLRHVAADGTVSAPIAGVPEVYFKSQGGLFDVVLHPNFSDNRTLYLTYAGGTPDDNGTAITRAEWRGGDALTNPKEIFRVSRRKDTPVHYGGRLAFLPDGTMLLTTGDGFSYRHEAQEISSQLGKTLRMNDDGSAAAGNPFPQAPYVWSYGHRNPQGLTVTASGEIYLNEHGPQGGDELNRIIPGANYGWPAICYCLDYTGGYVTPFTEWEGMEQPEHYWRPSIAPSGLAEMNGDFYNGALVDMEVRRLNMDANGKVTSEDALFSEVAARVRDVRRGPDGWLYFTVEGENGRLLRAKVD